MEPELRLGHDLGECTDVCGGVVENSITRAAVVAASVIVSALPSSAVSFVVDRNALPVLALSGPGASLFVRRTCMCCVSLPSVHMRSLPFSFSFTLFVEQGRDEGYAAGAAS